MSKRDFFRLEGLKKQLIYILGKRPDEFGLVPDKEGFIKIKELIQVLHEEGFGFVRESHINELMMHDGRDFFEIDGKRIRAKEIGWELELENPVYDLPKLLYICIRRRAYSTVMEKGLFSSANSYIILFPSKDMALRVGKRKDPDPVLLEIMVYDAMEKGSQFFRFGELYLSSWISEHNILGPPLDKEELEHIKKKKEKERKDKDKKRIEKAFSAGTFVLKEPKDKKAKGKKKKGWKEGIRKARKRKDMGLF